MAKFKLPKSVLKMNKPKSAKEMGDYYGITINEETVGNARNKMESLNDEEFYDTIVRGMEHGVMRELLENHRKTLLQLALNDNNDENSQRYINDFSSPILNIEWMMLELMFSTSDEMKKVVLENRDEPIYIFNTMLQMLNEIRSDEKMLDSMLSLENKIVWDEN